MIDSYTATMIIVVFLIISGIILPILDRVPKVKDFISFRWILVVTFTALCIGVIIDFGHLDTSVRFAVVVGGIVLSALFIVVRSLEKAMINRWKFPRLRGRVQKGNVQAELSLNPKLEESRMGEISKFVTSQEGNDDYDEVMNKALFSEDIREHNRKESSNHNNQNKEISR